VTEPLTLTQIRARIRRWRCINCGANLRGCRIHSTLDPGGWKVKVRQGWSKLWLWIECPKCGYQNALWKLGVPRHA